MRGAPDPGPAGGRVGAVVVNKDAGGALLGCVASLRLAGIDNVVVVDNDSSDGSLGALAAADRDVVLVPTGANLGYGRAINAGATRLSNEFLIVSNPDIVVREGAVARLVAVLDENEDLALVGPQLSYPDGGVYPSARAFPSMATAVAHAFLGLFWPGNAWSRRYRLEQVGAPGGSGATASREVDWVSGAFFLARRAAFDSVGGFDEAYFMYVEDLDLCWRLRRAGWRVAFEPAAVVVHDQGLSAAAHPYRMLVAHHHSTWRFARRSTSGAGRLTLPVIALGIGARLVLALGREAVAARATPGRTRGGRPASAPQNRGAGRWLSSRRHG